MRTPHRQRLSPGLRSGRCLVLLALGLGFCLCSSGCERQPDPPAASAGAQASGQQDDDRHVQELMALPYAGWTEDEDQEPDGLVFIDPERSWNGYTLFTITFTSRAYLVDHAGEIVHSWIDDSASRWLHSYLLDDNDLLVIGVDEYDSALRHYPDEKRFLMRLAWDGRLRWKRHITAHHDAVPTPDGKISVLTFAYRNVSFRGQTLRVRDDNLTIVDDEGNSEPLMSVWDATQSAGTIPFPLSMVPESHLTSRPCYDLFHTNTIEWMDQPHLFGIHPIYRRGNCLMCFRHQHRIAVFDTRRKRVLWTWGRGELSGPHDPRVLPNGNILLFDNGVSQSASRVIEVDPLAEEIVWEFAAPHPTDFFTLSKGSAQRLPNGNTLIVNSDNGEMFEVTRAADVVWRYLCPDRDHKGRRAAIARARRFHPMRIEPLLSAGP